MWQKELSKSSQGWISFVFLSFVFLDLNSSLWGNNIHLTVLGRTTKSSRAILTPPFGLFGS